MKALGLFIVLLLAGPAAAQQAPTPAFETCLRDLITDNRENPFIDLLAIQICGEREMPIRRSCNSWEYWPMDLRAECQAKDAAYWREQLSLWQDRARAEGGVVEGGLHRAGMERCADGAAQDRESCETEVVYRSVLEYLSSPVRVEFFGSGNE